MTSGQDEAGSPPFAVRLLLAGLGVAAAAALLWLGVAVHLDRACVLMDTPYLPLCSSESTESDASRKGKLRARLASNPGDSDAWIQLTNIETGPRQRALFLGASTLAPTEPNVLMWRAGQALSSQQLPLAVELLVQLIEYRGKAEAAQALARLVASGEGTPLLLAHLPTANRWLPSVVASLAALKLPMTSALSLVAEASAKGMVTRQTVQSYIRALKTDGKWGDAYGLWLAQQRGPTTLLHNGRFDQPFQPDGFDWEVTPALPSRAGAIVSQRGSSNKSQILDIQFTGKPVPLPIIRQYVFAPPGKYVLRGKYMSSRLRMEQGLAWTARCTNDKAAAPVAGQSSGLMDTSGAWQAFQFTIAIPLDCGLVVSLQLETFAPFEATAGFKGRAAFDALELLPRGV